MNEEDNGFGPLKRRGNTAKFAAGVALAGAFVVLFYVTERSAGALYLGLSFLALAAGELLRRVFLLCEELRHRLTRYEGKWTKLLRSTFAFQQWRIILPTLALSLVLVFVGGLENVACSRIYLIFGINVAVLPALSFLVGLRTPSLVEESEISERENRKVADGLAWSYYFGYLKLVLPKLHDKINESTDYRHKIKPKKLFILWPKDCSVKGLINDADPNVQEVAPLEAFKTNQAGVRNRPYMHTIHKVQVAGGKEHHIVVEYATPLKTLFDMGHDDIGALSREDRDQQVMIFIRKLREILDKDKECRGKYELIQFPGEGSNIAKILVDAITNPGIQVDA